RILAHLELDPDGRDAVHDPALDLVDTLERVHALLDLPHDQTLEVGRVRARVDRDDGEDRHVERRVFAPRSHQPGLEPQGHQRGEGEDRDPVMPDRQLEQLHGATLTGAPSWRYAAPSVTTMRTPSRPCVTATCRSRRKPIRMWRRVAWSPSGETTKTVATSPSASSAASTGMSATRSPRAGRIST